MTFVEAAFIFPSIVCAISVLWLLTYLPRKITEDRMSEITEDRISDVGGLDDLDDLRWTPWTISMGWLPVTCWRGCLDLHSDDWWRTYLCRTCWHGCEDLHREDWWRAYVDQPEHPAGRREHPLAAVPQITTQLGFESSLPRPTA